ncbi:hypothetical protein [Labedella endophytica]|uniref:Uncharacterized protein n=1 Tax=Labedella endophytica TaxID=1523160 RepID=A0A3S0XD37_9MICO|nr:hypothetical protein [Labedella endophytica]RUR03070.1 hypothetical protein ELQ94_00485 [Labedella endophytica]
MTDDVTDRRAELIAAALASELTPDEVAELDALRAEDPTIDADLADFGVILGSVRSVEMWDEDAPTSELAARVAGIADDTSASEQGADASVVAPVDRAGDGSRRRPTRVGRFAFAAAAAAACVAIGVGGGVMLATPAAPPSGPAGALGAVESVSFDGEPAGVEVDGDVIAHTWGTETVLTIDGLPVGDVYDVIVLDGSGREWSAGTFLGSEVTIDCTMNASVLRPDAVQVQVRAADGTKVATAALPSVAG